MTSRPLSPADSQGHRKLQDVLSPNRGLVNKED